eukprot:1157954-Pelagomonas_calceolata.AAC.5
MANGGLERYWMHLTPGIGFPSMSQYFIEFLGSSPLDRHPYGAKWTDGGLCVHYERCGRRGRRGRVCVRILVFAIQLAAVNFLGWGEIARTPKGGLGKVGGGSMGLKIDVVHRTFFHPLFNGPDSFFSILYLATKLHRREPKLFSQASCLRYIPRVARALGVLAHGLRRGALSCIPPHTPGLRIPTAITNVLLSAHGGGVEESGRPRAVAQQQGPCSSCMQLLAFKSRRKLERAAQRDEGWKWDVDECAGFGQLLVPFMPSGFKDWDARSTIGGLGACLPAWWMQEC